MTADYFGTTEYLGVVIVTFNAADVILDCLESLLASTGVGLHVVVVDNGSDDDTVLRLRQWASGQVPFEPSADLPLALSPFAKSVSLEAARPGLHLVRLIETGLNLGFAGGVNRGLAYLAALPEIDRIWILNPDSVVAPEAAAAFAAHPEPKGGFALIGGRVLYLDHPEIIQIDGGTVDRRTGVTGNIGLGANHATTPPPDPAALDFIMGGSMVVSRRFYTKAGPMPEEYFLYYEEVDWAMRRGDLPLLYCAEAIVYHRAGTAIGSPALGQFASPFSLYFKHRAMLQSRASLP